MSLLSSLVLMSNTEAAQNKSHFTKILQNGRPKIRHTFRKISEQKMRIILGRHCTGILVWNYVNYLFYPAKNKSLNTIFTVATVLMDVGPILLDIFGFLEFSPFFRFFILIQSLSISEFFE